MFGVGVGYFSCIQRQRPIETEPVGSVTYGLLRRSFPRLHSSPPSIGKQTAKPLLSSSWWCNLSSFRKGKGCHCLPLQSRRQLVAHPVVLCSCLGDFVFMPVALIGKGVYDAKRVQTCTPMQTIKLSLSPQSRLEQNKAFFLTSTLGRNVPLEQVLWVKQVQQLGVDFQWVLHSCVFYRHEQMAVHWLMKILGRFCEWESITMRFIWTWLWEGKPWILGCYDFNGSAIKIHVVESHWWAGRWSAFISESRANTICMSTLPNESSKVSHDWVRESAAAKTTKTTTPSYDLIPFFIIN